MSERRLLPQRRRSETFELYYGNQNSPYFVTLGYYPEHTIGEVFISTNAIGSGMDAMARDLAIVMSLALQHGCPIETIRGALTREADGKPSTIAGAVVDAITNFERDRLPTQG